MPTPPTDDSPLVQQLFDFEPPATPAEVLDDAETARRQMLDAAISAAASKLKEAIATIKKVTETEITDRGSSACGEMVSSSILSSGVDVLAVRAVSKRTLQNVVTSIVAAVDELKRLSDGFSPREAFDSMGDFADAEEQLRTGIGQIQQEIKVSRRLSNNSSLIALKDGLAEIADAVKALQVVVQPPTDIPPTRLSRNQTGGHAHR